MAEDDDGTDVKSVIEEETSVRDILELEVSKEEQDDGTGGTGGKEPSGAGDDGVPGKRGDDGAAGGEGESGVQGLSKPAVEPESKLPGKEDTGESVQEVSGDGGKPADDLKAPTTWRPALREKWSGMDDDVKREILKREHDMTRGMHESSQARQFTEQFGHMIQPYMAQINAENSTPIDAIQNLMNTAHRFRTDPPQQKAEMVADLIGQFGVDLQALDNILIYRRDNGAGATPGAGNGHAIDPATQSWMQQQMAPVTQFMQELQAGRQQANVDTQERVSANISEFAGDPKNEFYADVRLDMADLMELAAKRGQALDLPEAYRRATMARSDIAEVLAQRKVEEAAQQSSRNAQSARNAAVSVEGVPPDSGNPGLNPDASLRQHLESVWDNNANDV